MNFPGWECLVMVSFDVFGCFRSTCTLSVLHHHWVFQEDHFIEYVKSLTVHPCWYSVELSLQRTLKTCSHFNFSDYFKFLASQVNNLWVGHFPTTIDFCLVFHFLHFMFSLYFIYFFCLISSYFPLFLLVIYDQLDFLSFVQV